VTPPSASFTRLVERLSAASVRRRWEAYRDIDWDDPALHMDGDDPRWRLPSWDPVGAAVWYLDQPHQAQSRLGLLRVVTLLKVGIEFEALLQRGLLQFASTLPDRHPAFRYVYHEIAEEAQHSMMFQELVNRSGVDVPASSDWVGSLFGAISGEEDGDWCMFFLAALTAEHVFDQLQRRLLGTGPLHPLFRRICEIHIAEEARHLSFARAFLREAVPVQPDDRRRLMCFRAPFVVERMTRHIMSPPVLTDVLVDAWHLPLDVKESIVHGGVSTDLRQRCASGVVELCEQLGLVEPRLASRWSKVGETHPEPGEVAG
jgi:hypothetical protein